MASLVPRLRQNDILHAHVYSLIYTEWWRRGVWIITLSFLSWHAKRARTLVTISQLTKYVSSLVSCDLLFEDLQLIWTSLAARHLLDSSQYLAGLLFSTDKVKGADKAK